MAKQRNARTDRSDGKAKLGSAVMVLDEVRKAGIDQVSIETVPSTTGN